MAKALAILKEKSVHSISNSASMMVVMTEEQKRMLGRYGRVTCVDATYRVVQWGLPFFLLVVVDEHHESFPVAYFMVAEETDISIVEVFVRIKGLVPKWDPGVFIMDKSDAEIGAVKKVFPNAVIILCEFHVKQAWLRWLKTSANGVPKEVVNIIYKALCEVMKASSTRVAKQKVQFNLSKGRIRVRAFRVWAFSVWVFRVKGVGLAISQLQANPSRHVNVLYTHVNIVLNDTHTCVGVP